MLGLSSCVNVIVLNVTVVMVSWYVMLHQHQLIDKLRIEYEKFTSTVDTEQRMVHLWNVYECKDGSRDGLRESNK